MINDIPADRIAEIEDDEGLQVVTWFPLNWDFVNFNHEFEPFKDERVRRAFDLMIDKEALLQGALWGQGQTTASPSYPDLGLLQPRPAAAAAGHRAGQGAAGRGGLPRPARSCSR